MSDCFKYLLFTELSGDHDIKNAVVWNDKEHTVAECITGCFANLESPHVCGAYTLQWVYQTPFSNTHCFPYSPCSKSVFTDHFHKNQPLKILILWLLWECGSLA